MTFCASSAARAALVLFCSAAILADIPSATAAPRPARGSYAQRREAQEALAAYRRARGSADRVRKAVQQAIAAGPHATAALAPVLAEDLQAQTTQYLGALSATAAKVAARMAPDPAEVAACRQKVLGLLNVDELTKQMIVEQAEPALARLGQLLRVDAAAVLAENGKLDASRAAVLEGGALWQMCLAGGAPPAAGSAAPPSFESLLAVEEELALLSPAAISPAAAQTLTANRRAVGDVDFEEYRGIQILNGWRLLLGLDPLAHDPRLTLAARDHSQDMLRLKFFAHESPVEGKRTVSDRAARFGAQGGAENIYTGASRGDAALDGWFHSPGHFKNLFGRHARVGLGRAEHLFTMVFGG